jgi:hypothetical protein
MESVDRGLQIVAPVAIDCAHAAGNCLGKRTFEAEDANRRFDSWWNRPTWMAKAKKSKPADVDDGSHRNVPAAVQHRDAEYEDF